MPLEISDAAIKKLCHDIPEIRIRSLKSIETKFLNAIRHNEHISVNAALLLKWLIRWFGQVQSDIDESDRVLGLMLSILKSKYGQEAVITLGHSKLCREVQKIKTILTATAPENKILLHRIEEVLAEYHVKSNSSAENDGPLERHQSNSQAKDVLDIDLLTIVDEPTSFQHNGFLDNFVEVWEKPCASDMNSIKLLKSSLRSDTEEANVQHALQFLNVAINDFPAEYFLQPPYIFFSLKSLVDKKNRYATDVLQKFSHLTRAFRKRIIMRNLSKVYCPDNRNNDSNVRSPSKTQISVEKYFHDLFRTNLEYFKDLIDTPNRQDDINKSFCLMFDLMDLLQFSSCNASFEFVDEILNDLGNTVKFFRQTWLNSTEPESHRNHYITLLSVICQMASLKGTPHIRRKSYDPTEFTSFSINSSEHPQNTTASMSTSTVAPERSVWLQELEIACYDYSIEQFYGDMYNRMSSIAQADLSVQKQCSLVLANAVDLLKLSSIEFDNNTLLSKGLLAMDTISLHKSLELTKKLLVTIVKCVPYFEGNNALQLNAENLFLRILSHEDFAIKRNVYQMCAQKMKYYFSSLMDGAQILNHFSLKSQTHFLGIPLNVDILIEIICFGCTHQEADIRDNASTIVSLILRSRTMLDGYWKCIWEILMPVMPLIECYASKLTDLGKTMMEFLDPDNIYCPFIELFKGNIRLLFSTEATVRDEAVARLLYMLLSYEPAESYLPNISNITDVIPNSVCILESSYDPQKVAALQSGTFDRTSMRPLIELLACNDVEPSVRKATFTQLNVMVQDPQLNDVLNQENGLFLVLQALENSMKTEHHIDYPDTAIPAVGIIAKMCVQYPKLRTEVSQEINVLCLLVRALVLFYHHESFKQDCAVALFLLVFSDYTTGGGQLSLPILCDRLKVPVKNTPHWITSPFNKKSDLERLLFYVHDTDQSNGIWQNVRFTFASLWFGGLEHVFDKSNGLKIDYDENCRFEFDQSLRLTKTDISLLRATSISLTLHNRLQTITNATNHLVAQSAIAELTNYMLLPSNDTLRKSSKSILTAVQRFCATTPNTQSDDATFAAVCKLLADLVQKDFYEVQIWILEELRRKNCSYLTILNGNIETTPKLFSSNCRFLGVILHESMQSTNSKVQDLLASPMESHRSLLAYYFDVMIKQLDEHYSKRELDKLRALLTLMRIVTIPNYRIFLDYDDDEFVGYVANKLLYLIAVIKSLAQAGSNFNKNCLMTVGNLLATESVEEVKINSKYVKLLSGLCGHADVQIRATSWSILSQLSRTLCGATQLIKELAYLPGGFHACCLSTFMDPYEASVVRETAGCLFANLLKFRSGIRQLPIAVAPICSENNSNTSDEGVISLVLEILMRQRFFTCLSNAFKSYWPHDVIDHDVIGPTITTCDIMRTYCAILLNLIALQPNIVTDLHANGIVFDMFRVIPSVLLSASRSAWLMFVEICNFMVSCFSYEPEILTQISMQEYAVVSALLSCFDQTVYDAYGPTLGVKCIISSVLLLDAVTSTSNGTEQICHLISEDTLHLENLLQLVELGIELHKQHPDLCQCILRLIGKLLTLSLVSVHSERYASVGYTFASLLDNNSLNTQESGYFAVKNDEHNENDENRNSKQSNHSQSRKTTFDENISASELLFQMLSDFMQRVRSQPTLSEPTVTVISMLLKCSQPARATATANGFLQILLKELNEVHAKFGMACSEFIRRHGDSKKEPILTVIRNLYSVILNWYSIDVMLCEKDAQDLCRLSIKLWPWIGTNQRLQLIYMRSFTFLSEDSVLMCKVMSTCHPITESTSTMLQLFVDYIVAETSRAKHPMSHLMQLQLAMRIVSNCCSCIEGRMLLMKTNVLDSLNRLHPAVTKLQKPWITITTMWLRLYDILTRYPDPKVGVRHLSLLCTFVLKSSLRLQALVVMRNMSFSVANRAALLASDEYLYAIKSVIETGTVDEQLLAITSIWKLIANSYKAKHSIRNGSILSKIQTLSDRMQSTDTNDIKSSELIDAINMVLQIFSK